MYATGLYLVSMEGQKRALNPLGLELQVVGCFYVLLGAEPGSSGRRAT